MLKSLLRWLGRGALVGSIAIGLVLSWQWAASRTYRIQSKALQEPRTYRVFNEDSSGPIIYCLDGHSLRNSLAPAVLLSFAAILRGHNLPKVVAIYSNANRDRDFRPLNSVPANWRRKIVGRSSQFDKFLLAELIPEIENREVERVPQYLMGHSLSGLYALDLATREPGRFAGIFAFAPTFSHDTSISERLPLSCHAETLLYANWGLESARDTAVFDATVTRWMADPNCRQNTLLTPRHYGSLHHTIMLTGQLHTAFLLLK